MIGRSIQLPCCRKCLCSFTAAQEFDDHTHRERCARLCRKRARNLVGSGPDSDFTGSNRPSAQILHTLAIHLHARDGRTWGLSLVDRHKAPVRRRYRHRCRQYSLIGPVVYCDLQFPVPLVYSLRNNIERWLFERDRTLVLLIGKIVLFAGVAGGSDRDGQRANSNDQRPTGQRYFAHGCNVPRLASFVERDAA
jgi:hypothetical protein